MQERYIAAVDLGSSKIALSVARIEGKDVQIHYYKELPSEGISLGQVSNPRQASATLQKLVKDANEELGIKITQIVVGLPRYRVDQETTSGRINRTDPDTSINAEEVSELIDLAMDDYNVADSDNREIYGAVSQSFAVEEQSLTSENDVIGAYSSFLEGNFSFFIGPKRPIKNIRHMLNEAGLAMAKQVFVPGATAGAVLTEDEKENGVALVEIGGNITSVTVYKGKRLKYYSAIPFGGKTITADIKNECGFSDNLAENIKLAFGSCTPENLFTLTEKIIQINSESGSYDRLSVKYLAEIIKERTKELIEAILYMIWESGFSEDLRSGMVITGGGAKLCGLKRLLKQISGYEVRYGYPSANKFRVEGVIQATEMSAASTMGIILESQRDSKLNCISAIEFDENGDVVETAVNEGAAETAGKAKEEEVIEEPTIFDAGEIITVKPKKKEPKEKKDKKSIKWMKQLGGKIENAAAKGFDNLFGSYYDEMEENK